ncbi:hypothetical protein [Haloferula sp. BvORR071]|uniref:hypothetical protein n=1 Tax=Haloferula sp. BvORR071 TaxID=1396141 RepID=UPI000554825E|nr:hypothetical protein [Haloferula sp. BvORR071]
MSRVHDPTVKAKAGVLLALPPIALSELKEPTKDFLLAKANAGATPLETMKELLDRGAERAGFRAKRAAAAEASRTAEAWAAEKDECGMWSAERGVSEARAATPNTGSDAASNNNSNGTQREGGDER